MSKNHRLSRDERRAQLITVATAEFAESGYSSSSMDGIAARAGISKPILYQHFDSKQSMYVAVVSEAADTVSAMFEAGLHSTTDPRERIKATFTAFFTFAAAHRAQFLVLFHGDSYEAEAAGTVDRIRSTASETIAEVIVSATDRDAVEAELLGRALVGMAEFAASHVVTTGTLDAERAAELMSDMTWNGTRGFVPGEDA